jgi:hypothetical protein
MKPNLTLGLAAAASLLLPGAAGTAFAHPHPGGDGEKVRRFVIINDGGDQHAGGDRIRRFKLHGPDGPADCGGDKIVDEQTNDDGKTTKVIICRKGEPTAAEAEHLEKALARIAESDHLSDEQKARIETALRSAIDRARSAR